MTAKEYLEQIEQYSIKIKQTELELECLRETAGGASAIRYDKDRVQVSIVDGPLERNVMMIIDLEEKLFVLKMKYRALVAEASRIIQSLENENDRIVLKLHYIDFYSFNRMAAELNKDVRWLKRVHNRALDSFKMLYNP